MGRNEGTQAELPSPPTCRTVATLIMDMSNFMSTTPWIDPRSIESARNQLSPAAIDVLDRHIAIALSSGITDDPEKEVGLDLQFANPLLPMDVRLYSLLFQALQPASYENNGSLTMGMPVVEEMITISQAILALRDSAHAALQDDSPNSEPFPIRISLPDVLFNMVERLLADWYYDRYKMHNSVEDLDSAIRIRRKKYDDRIDDDARRHNEHSLCELLTVKYRLTHDLDIITEAIAHGRDSLQACLDGDQEGDNDPEYLRTLAIALVHRAFDYELPGDIDDGLATMKSAIAAAEVQQWSSQQLFVLRCNLVTALLEKIRVANSSSDTVADECIRLCRENLLESPTDIRRHFQLADSLFLKCRHTNVQDDKKLCLLDEAISILDKVEEDNLLNLDSHEPDDSALRMCEGLLAECLRDRYSATGSSQDLYRSRDIAQKVEGSPESFPQEKERANLVLCGVFARIYARDRDPEDCKSFLEYTNKVTSNKHRDLETTRNRIEAYSVAGSLHYYFKEYKEALKSFMSAVETLPHLLLFGRNRLVDTLDKWNMLGAWAAAAGACCGRPDLSVQALELGRSIVWARALKMRSRLDELEADYPKYAKRLKELNEGCEQLELSQSIHVTSILKINEKMVLQAMAWKRRLTFGRKWDALVKKIQHLDGYSDFLRGPTYKSLRGVAEEGPVILINVSDFRSDAFILSTSARDRPQIVCLPDGLDALCREWSDMLLKGAKAVEAGSMTEAIFSKTILSPILHQLWLQILLPVRQCLNALSPYARRIWLCPTGRLTFLPIHMIVNGPLHGTSSYLPLIPSYTITLSSLLRARSSPTADEPMRLLAVSCATVEGYAKLPGANKELEALQNMMTDKQITVLQNSSATIEKVLDALPRHNWLHMACNGEQDFKEPYQSHFVLHDGHLQMSNFMALRLKDIPQFAFLSACQSASGIPNVSDEAMHLAASLHVSGFRGIAATMWAVDDGTARRVVAEMYPMLLKNRTLDGDPTPRTEDTAEALWKAIENLREKGLPVSRLTPFVHIGI